MTTLSGMSLESPPTDSMTKHVIKRFTCATDWKHMRKVTKPSLPGDYPQPGHHVTDFSQRTPRLA